MGRRKELIFIFVFSFFLLLLSTLKVEAIICATGYYCTTARQNINSWSTIEGLNCYYRAYYSCNGDDDDCRAHYVDTFTNSTCSVLVHDNYGCCLEEEDDECDTCTPTCPSGSATSPVTDYPVTASCSNGSGCPDSEITCYYQRQDLCTNSIITDQWIKSGESTWITTNANTDVNYFIYLFYNKDHLIGGVPQPICRTYDATWAPNQGVCPGGSYQLQTFHYYATPRTIDTLIVPASKVFVSDMNNGNAYVDSIQVNVYLMITGLPMSYPDIDCVVSFNHCTPLCTPTCVYPLTDTITPYGSTQVSCSNTPSECGTESRICYCNNCTAPNCPSDLSNTNLGFGVSTLTTSCTNTCNYTNYRTCYCRDCTLPIPTGTTLTNTGKQSTLPEYQTTSCSKGTGCPNKTAPLYCIRCTPPACAPTYATTPQYSPSGEYLGSTNLTCNNILPSCNTESRTCYCYDCIQSCPSPLSDTEVVTDPNLILEDFRSCATGCGVSRTEDCFEVPSPQPTEGLTMPNPTPPYNDYYFRSLTHTGIPLGGRVGTLNDPVSVTATYTDVNGASDIEGLFVWIRDSNITLTPSTPLSLGSASPQATSTSSWGFMMHKEGNSWVPYVTSYDVSPAVWTRAIYDSITRTFMISGPSGQNMVEVRLTSPISLSGTVATMPFSLRFSGSEIYESVSQIRYRVYLMGLDRFSFTPSDNYNFSVSDYWATDQLRYRTSYSPSQTYARSWYNTGKLWTIDEVSPSVSFINNTPLVTGNTIRLDWSASDVKNLYSIVGNIYSTAGADSREISLSSPTVGVTLAAPFTPTGEISSNIGRLNTGWAFKVFPNMSVTTHTGSVTIDIGANRVGTLIFYITAFDDAGNVHTFTQNFNLDDWFVTDGGLAYSAQDTNFRAKETTADWTGKLPPFPVSGWIESLTNTKADLSTEMWAEDALLSPLRNIDLVDSYVINGHGGYSITNYSTELKEAYILKRSTIPNLVEKNFTNYTTTAGALISTGVLCGPSDGYCVLNFTGNLIIRSNLKCNRRVLLFVDGNLTINPPLRNSQTNIMDASRRNGCIFVVGGDMVIDEGANQSSPTIFAYDVIHGYFFVDGKVTILHEESKDSDDIYDGVYINGGVHTLGGILINRYLRLIDRLNYPVVAIDHHSKYGVLGGMFFGSNFNLQKVEVGFKPQ